MTRQNPDPESPAPERAPGEDEPRPLADLTPEAGAGYASPVCYAAEMDPGYFGYLSRAELLELLNTLLEAERAGAKVAAAWEGEAAEPALRALLAEVKRDEARFVAMLTRLVQRLGGEPSRATGNFVEKALALDGPPGERLRFLNRGQGWVIRKLAEALPRIPDDSVHGELRDMLEVHEANVARCEAAIGASGD